MSRLLWLVRHHSRDWGGWVALAVLLGAAGFYFAAVEPLEQRVAALERQRASQREGQLRQIGAELARKVSPRDQLTNFYKYFGQGDSLTDQLARLNAVAVANGIELRRAEYRMSAQPDHKLDRYQIIIPLQAPYATIRRFASRALAELPTMSLNQVQIQRKAIGDNAVDAQITFTLYLIK